MQTKVRGIRSGGSGQEVDIGATRGGDLHISQALPQAALITALGNSWTAITTSAVAAIVDEPTVTAHVTLYNGEADGGKSYIIERMVAYQDVSAAVPSRWAIWACVHPVGRAADTADITLIGSLSGGGTYGGNGKVDVDQTVTNDGWSPWMSSLDVEVAGILGGAVGNVFVDGRIIVPPSAAVSIAIVASAVDDTFTTGFHWHEVLLDLS